jgi:hypothetical protein
VLRLRGGQWSLEDRFPSLLCLFAAIFVNLFAYVGVVSCVLLLSSS